MTRQTDELDQFIDAVNAGDSTALDRTTDPDLMALMHTVLRIRQLQEANWPEADWPERAVRHLAHEFGQTGGSDTDRESAQPIAEERVRDAGHSDPTPLPQDPARHAASGRRRFPRELVQMAAAIVVLVVVGGVLAVTFRTQGQRQPGAIGSGATPAASSGLPMTVTAHGIAVTMEMVDPARSATRFHVSIALPAYAVGQPASFILGPAPANDVQVAGMNVSATTLHATQNDTTASNHVLFLDYPAPFPTNRTVTLTIKQLWLPAKPTSPAATPSDLARDTPVPVQMQAVTGPWTFHLTPTMVATQPLPTPQSGMACAPFVGLSHTPKLDCYPPISATVAQRLVGFPIIEPTPLPAGLTRNPFAVGVDRLGTTSATQPNYVSLDYWLHPSSSGQQEVQLIETTNHAAVPTINGGMASIVTPLSSGGPPQTLTIRSGTLATLTIDGVSVTRFAVGPPTTGTTYFVWTQAGVSSSIAYTVSPPNPKPLVTDAELQQMVTSIIEQRAGQATSSSTSPASSEVLPPPTANGDASVTVALTACRPLGEMAGGEQITACAVICS